MPPVSPSGPWNSRTVPSSGAPAAPERMEKQVRGSQRQAWRPVCSSHTSTKPAPQTLMSRPTSKSRWFSPNEADRAA